MDRGVRRLLPIAGGLLGIGLAWRAERLIEAGDTTWLGVALFLAGILVFVASAWPLRRAPLDRPVEAEAPGASRGHVVILAMAIAVALALNVAGLYVLWPQWTSSLAVWLWVASIVGVTAGAIAVRRSWEWPPQWGTGALPRTTAGRVLLAAAVVGIVAVASAGRLLWLDRIPLGINPDEGDRASTAIRVLRGTITTGIFDYGWFGINILYFWVLGQVMKVAGISFVGARVLGALSGIVTVATVTWMGIRHFGYRVGVMAGALLATLGIALQFGRETTEATPTALLWTLSAAAWLEAVRRGRSTAWVFAGIAGGLSFYFYPTGRLWAALAALFSVYLLVHGVGRRRLSLVRGVALTALAAVLVISPFLIRAAATNWESIVTRARMTSIFVPENPRRLRYYQPEWSMPRLLRAQVERSLGVFNRYPDLNGFWPTARPLMWGPLAVLTLMGLGWVCLRPRDPRCALLAIWFWAGFVGVIVTVETPNVQRMGTAIPVLAFFPALILDSLARRVEVALPRMPGARRAPSVVTAVLMLIIAMFMVSQWRFYFYKYGPMNEWSGPTLMGRTVAAQGEDTQVLSLGRQFHISNQGWVRLLAANTPRGGVISPGTDLPLPLPADSPLAFMVMPEQPYYLPYLRALYPNGTTSQAIDRGQVLFQMYRISQEQRAATQGALALPPHGTAVRVARLGEAPPDWSVYPSPMHWTAAWRVPRYWNYALRVGPGPARLRIDNTLVLEMPEGATEQTVQVSLAQGDHFVEYDGMLSSPGEPARFEWATIPSRQADHPAPPLEWQAVLPGTLRPADRADGLFAVVSSEGRADQHRLDGTLAFGNLTVETRISAPYTAHWTGTLHAPTGGQYGMSLFTQGAIELRIDGQAVLSSDGPRDRPIDTDLSLAAGPHPVDVMYRLHGGGALEWTWVPPGGERSIVPRSVLTPPPGAGVGPVAPSDTLGPAHLMPASQPIEIAK